LQCGGDPSFVVAGRWSNSVAEADRAGKTFVVEAASSTAASTGCTPRRAYYQCRGGPSRLLQNIDEIIESFHQFARLVKAEGLILAMGRT